MTSQTVGVLAAPLDLTVMMYHYVRDAHDVASAGPGANVPGLSLERFTRQIDELARRHSMVAWADVRSALRGDAKRALPPDACLLTFDDGLCDHYLNVFPLLRARGVSGLFFVMARQPGEGLTLPHKLHFLLPALGLERMRGEIDQHLDVNERLAFAQAEQSYPARWGELGRFKTVLQRELSGRADPWLSALFAEHIGDEAEVASRWFLSQAQAREMAAGGMHLGGHSYSHPWFDFVDAAALEAEVAASATWLSAVEPGQWAFAYPYGGLNPAAPEILRAHNFAAAFTTVEQTRHEDAYWIGRLDGEEMTEDGGRGTDLEA